MDPGHNLGTIQGNQIIALYTSIILPVTGLSNQQQNNINTFKLWTTAFKAHNIPKMVLLLTEFHIRGAFVYEFVENKIQEIRMYYDSSVLRRHDYGQARYQ